MGPGGPVDRRPVTRGRVAAREPPRGSASGTLRSSRGGRAGGCLEAWQEGGRMVLPPVPNKQHVPAHAVRMQHEMGDDPWGTEGEVMAWRKGRKKKRENNYHR